MDKKEPLPTGVGVLVTNQNICIFDVPEPPKMSKIDPKNSVKQNVNSVNPPLEKMRVFIGKLLKNIGVNVIRSHHKATIYFVPSFLVKAVVSNTTFFGLNSFAKHSRPLGAQLVVPLFYYLGSPHLSTI